MSPLQLQILMCSNVQMPAVKRTQISSMRKQMCLSYAKYLQLYNSYCTASFLISPKVDRKVDAHIKHNGRTPGLCNLFPDKPLWILSLIRDKIFLHMA